MYTDSMRKAVHSIHPPKNFGIQIIDNQHFLTIKLNEKQFLYMNHDEKMVALKYITQVKKALEQCGAIVLITREAIK
jgi:hypothetical protein